MKTAAPAAASPPAEPPPKYRYFTVPPATVRLTVDDLTALLPEGAWIGREADKSRELALPAAEILETNYPRIRFARLRDFLPGCIRPLDDAPTWVPLPTDRVALAYRPETRRESLANETPAETTPPPGEAAAPAEKSAVANPAPAEKKLNPSWKRLPKPTLAPPPSSEIEPPPAPEPAPAPPVHFPHARLAAEAESRLQHTYHTDEDLTVTRVVELAGALPGLQGCILTHGQDVLRSPGAPAGLDPFALGDASLDLLARAGVSSGLRLKPALTLYAESGPLSLLREGELCLLVVHRERGFLPGIREKLEATLQSLPGPQSREAS